MTAVYAFHLSSNQPFVEGNKRAGLAAALVFLAINGIDLEDPAGELERAMRAEASRDEFDLPGIFRTS